MFDLSSPEYQCFFPPEEFAVRRSKIMDEIGDGACALLQGAPPVRDFGRFRQTNEFYYCCGVELPQCYLLIDGRGRTTSLYLPYRGAATSSEGQLIGAEDADYLKETTGIENVYALDQLVEHLKEVPVVYTMFTPAEGTACTRWTLMDGNRKIALDPWDAQPSREQRFMGLLQTRYPRIQIKDLTSIIDGLRAVKSPREVNALRRAGRLCGMAVREAIRVTKPGLIEYQLGALADYIYRLNGANGDGYRPIIANGENIWFSHYYKNDCPLVDGDMVLMDGAPEVGVYTSDIGRMWPVNGTYSPLQRELYGYMVHYHKTVLSKIRPGITSDNVMDEAAAEMAPIVEQTKWSKQIYKEAAERTLTFRGHLSHPVGMAVHDDGRYYGLPLVPGMVFSVDPQMWIPEEKLYIRIEDTVAITETGMEVLTLGAPVDLDDVETLMKNDPAELPYWLKKD